jgi:hypothetical protein
MTNLIEGDRCPKCQDAIDEGYGLAFGGFGSYQYCLNQACDWHVKDRECPVCEAVDCKEHEQ